MIIEVEGIDGTGKSFLSKELALAFEVEHHKTPNRLDAVRTYFDFSPDARYTFYLLDSSELPDVDLVVDRYVLSTVAYHSAMRPVRRDTYEAIAKNLIHDGFLERPDIVVYLSVSEDERLRRIKQRHSEYSLHDLDGTFLREVDAVFKDLISEDFFEIGSENYIEIDTTNLSKEDVITYTKDKIEEVLAWK